MQQITRGDYLKDLITINIENNTATPIEELYSKFIFQCGEDIQKVLTPAEVITISFDEKESLLLKTYNTCYLAGITVDGHKETFTGSLTFNTRGEVVYYEPTVTASATSDTFYQGVTATYSNCSQTSIVAYFTLNYVPSKVSELENDADYQSGAQVEESISIHNSSTEAHTYIQDLISTEASLRASATEALLGSIQAETTAREEAVSLAISTTEGYTDNSVSIHNSSTEAHPYIQSVFTSATEALTVAIGDLDNLDTSVKTSVVNAINSEVSDRQNADSNLQGQIDALAAASDVTDIVGTYADLENYDTQHLNNNDIIKVLSDSTHDNQPSYYRFNKTAGTFSYIGSESAAYTKAQSDSIFVTKTTEINGHALSSDITLTASDVGALPDSTTIGNGALTIQRNGTGLGTFTANATSATTVNISVPTTATEVGALPSTTTINDLTTTAQQNALNSGVTSTVVNQVGTNTSDISSLKDLSNLTSNGGARLHALKSYKDEGELLTDAEGLADVVDYAHSTFDLSKFTVVGSPTITSDGIASGFSSSNYITHNGITLTNNNTFSIEGTFTTPNTLSSNDSTIINFSDSWAANIGYNGQTFYASIIDQAILFTYYLQPNKEYMFKYEFDGNNFIVSIKPSSEEIYETKTKSLTSPLFTYNNLLIGYRQGYFDGSIDLKQFSITVDGVEVFSGNKTGIDTIKSDDYTKVGSVTITPDGIVSGFSDGNYINIGSQFSYTNLVGHNWKMDLEFTYNAVDTSDTQAIIQFFNDGANNSVRIQNNQVWCSLNTTTYTEKILSTTLVDENVYKVTLEYNKITQKYKLSLYKDGVLLSSDDTFVTGELTISNSNLSNFFVGRGTNVTSWYLRSSIDLNSFKIYVDDSLVYQPCLKIPYTESKTGSKIVNAVYRDRVNDMAEQFGYAPYYTLSNADFTLPQGELYGNIQQTLRNTKQNGISKNYLYSDRMQIQTGSCTSGVEVTLPVAFADANYALTVPYSAKSATAFTPTATGDWIAIGLGNL